MGLFGGTVSLNLPTKQFKSAEDIFGEGLEFGRGEFPLALEAREAGLERIGAGALEPGPEFFEQFQPTSFEKALGAEQFKDIDRRIRQSLSLAGIESSPVLAEQRTKAGVNIGSILAELGQRRAELSLRGREVGILQQLGIDPLQAIEPFTTANRLQSNLQTESDFQTALQKAIFDFQKRAENANLFSTIGKVGGGILGTAFGGPAGGALASRIGGGIGGLFDPRIQDISSITGQARPADSGGLDIASLVDIFGAGGGAKTTQPVDVTGTGSVLEEAGGLLNFEDFLSSF